MYRHLLLTTLTLLSVPALAGDWNQWRGPDRNGLGDATPLVDRLPEADVMEPSWVRERIPAAFSGGWSSPLVVDGKVYLFVHANIATVPRSEIPERKYLFLKYVQRQKMTDEEIAEHERKSREERLVLSKYYKYAEQVHCRDAATGKTDWVREIDSFYTRTIQSGTPCIREGRIYELFAGLVLRCLDASDGRDLWTRKLPVEFVENQHYMSSPTIMLVVLAGRLFGVDLATGEVVWQSPAESHHGNHPGSRRRQAVCPPQRRPGLLRFAGARR